MFEMQLPAISVIPGRRVSGEPGIEMAREIPGSMRRIAPE
jgi:hypothetical protein